MLAALAQAGLAVLVVNIIAKAFKGVREDQIVGGASKDEKTALSCLNLAFVILCYYPVWIWFLYNLLSVAFGGE